MRKCKKCGLEQEDSEFSHKYDWCKSCKRAYYRENRERTKERSNLRSKEYHRNKKNNESAVNNKMQPEITIDTTYYWKLNKQMIILMNESGDVVRKFKNQYVEDEDFVGNVRWSIVVKFGIRPDLLKEK